MKNQSFAAFIMTYERSTVIAGTIDAILNQTYPPEKILIVDNSESVDTKELIELLGAPSIEYHRVGNNAGPAGAAKIGLQKLAEEGYQWIYWGDDDDPPTFNDSFEKLFDLINNESVSKVGLVGGVGQLFNRLTGSLDRVSDNVIKSTQSLAVDSVAGGQTMIVNADVVRMGILPDEDLFFGFEELDFCLKVKKAGFKIMVSSELFMRARQKYNRLNYKKPLYIKKDIASLTRQYYSIRNLLIILKREQLYLAYVINLIKGLMKSVWGFRFGWLYGKMNLLYLVRGIRDSISGKLGPFF